MQKLELDQGRLSTIRKFRTTYNAIIKDVPMVQGRPTTYSLKRANVTMEINAGFVSPETFVVSESPYGQQDKIEIRARATNNNNDDISALEFYMLNRSAYLQITIADNPPIILNPYDGSGGITKYVGLLRVKMGKAAPTFISQANDYLANKVGQPIVVEMFVPNTPYFRWYQAEDKVFNGQVWKEADVYIFDGTKWILGERARYIKYFYLAQYDNRDTVGKIINGKSTAIRAGWTSNKKYEAISGNAKQTGFNGRGVFVAGQFQSGNPIENFGIQLGTSNFTGDTEDSSNIFFSYWASRKSEVHTEFISLLRSGVLALKFTDTSDGVNIVLRNEDIRGFHGETVDVATGINQSQLYLDSTTPRVNALKQKFLAMGNETSRREYDLPILFEIIQTPKIIR